MRARAAAYKVIKIVLKDDLLKTIIKDDYSTVSMLTLFKRSDSPAIHCIVMSFSNASFYKAEVALEGWVATALLAEGVY